MSCRGWTPKSAKKWLSFENFRAPPAENRPQMVNLRVAMVLTELLNGRLKLLVLIHVLHVNMLLLSSLGT
jgi:hypothetical protein